MLQSIALSAQVGIGTDHPNSCAVLELKGNGKQGLLIPKVMDDYQSITNAPAGLIVYDLTINAIYLYDGSDWNKVNPSKTECNSLDSFKFKYTLEDKKLAYELSKKFAPILKFDKAVINNYYPTSLENIFKYSNSHSIVCGQKLATNITLKKKGFPNGDKNFPTYYGVQQSPDNSGIVFIDYWLAYIHQNSCMYSRFFSIGEHDYDWEHIVVQASKTNDKVYSVTYFQHGGWYTKKWDNIEKSGTHPLAYIGRLSHGMYYDKHTKASRSRMCFYYGDSRDPINTTIVNAWNNLKEMSFDAYGFGFDGKFGNANEGPLYRNRNYWDMYSCKGYAKSDRGSVFSKAAGQKSTKSKMGCQNNDYGKPGASSKLIGKIPNQL